MPHNTINETNEHATLCRPKVTPLPLAAGAGRGGTLSALYVLFILFALLAPEGGRAGEGQGVNSPWRVCIGVFILLLVC